VGFAPIEPREEPPPPTLSQEFRQNVAEVLVDMGRVSKEIREMRYASPSMIVALERAAAIETAARICRITEHEIKGE